MKMRVADYITDQIYKAGGEHVFLITGGMIMHLTDALLQHTEQKFTCCHHEQAATMAAEAYGRFTGKLGAVYVTAGPGALNAITGVVGAYVDSSPCIIVSGQSKASQAIVKGPRQFALQGFNNLELFEKITKYAVMLDDIATVKYEIEKAIYIAKSHRVGPVYVECPIDLQGAYFDPDEYEGFTPSLEQKTVETFDVVNEQVKVVAQAIQKSKRSLIIAGAGIRLSEAVELFHELVDKTGIPVLTSRLGMDLFANEHPLFVGRPGLYGDRPANFAIQNCDLFISIGCRLGIGIVGYDFQDFACHATKVVVDIDEDELRKPSVKPDIAIQADARMFIKMLIDNLGGYAPTNKKWVAQTQNWKKTYPVDLPEYVNEEDGINSYHFTRVFSEKMPKDAVFVLDTGSCFHVYAQAFNVKFGQRHIITGGLSTMGYMPGVIGVAVANAGHDVYCITGDGSIQMNLQELQTIAHNQLSAKIIVFNNRGYLLIRSTQNNFQEGRLMGESSETGVSFPELEKIAMAYGIHFIRIADLEELDKKLDELVNFQGPVICEVMTPANQLLIPRVASKKLDDGKMISMPYDDMFPFLSREEYLKNCVHKESE
jgi:acetolactate synthase-1/2/3 large subunit